MKKAIAVLALAAIAAAPASPVTSLAGRYSKHFKNGDAGGGVYWSDDVIEIVPVDVTHAYFNASLEFFNGHECGISGVASAVGNKLVYRETEADAAGRTCALSISASGGAILLDDKGGSCHNYCGARGTLSNFRFVPLSSKRPIGYLPKVLGSDEYKGAIDAWKSGKTR